MASSFGWSNSVVEEYQPNLPMGLDFKMEIIDPDSLTGEESWAFLDSLEHTPFHEKPEDFIAQARLRPDGKPPEFQFWRISADDDCAGIVVTSFEFAMDDEPYLSIDILAGKNVFKHIKEITDTLMDFAGHFGMKKLISFVPQRLAKRLEKEGLFETFTYGIIREK